MELLGIALLAALVTLLSLPLLSDLDASLLAERAPDLGEVTKSQTTSS